MTGRELLKKLEENGALDYELTMNVNMEPIPVARAIVIHSYQLKDCPAAIVKNVVILDN